MLPITVPETELFNETTEEFIYIPETKLRLEHSLLSIAKWEEKYHKPYLVKEKKTPDEFLDYIRMMTINKDINPNVYYGLTEDNLEDIKNYMEDSHTATWFREDDDKPKSKKERVITAELVYCWMIELRMPMEPFQKWHINRLITLIRTCQEEQKAQNPDSNKKIDMSKRRALMERRRAKSRARKH